MADRIDILLELDRRGGLPEQYRPELDRAKRSGTTLADLKAERERRRGGPSNANPGVSPDAPPEMIYDPETGGYTSRELLRNRYRMNGAGAFGVGGLNGATLGAADELAGATSALEPDLGRLGDVVPGLERFVGAVSPASLLLPRKSDSSAAQRYVAGRDNVRAMKDVAQDTSPTAYTAGEITGGAATGTVVGAPVVGAGRSLGAQSLRGAGVGAVEGGAYGFMDGEGGLAERAKTGGMGSLFGAAAGTAAPYLTSSVRGVGRMAGNVVGGAVNRIRGKGSETRANRALNRTLNRSGMSEDELLDAILDAARDGQPEYRVMDALGQAGQRRASGLVRGGQDASQEIANYLRSRQLDQPQRVSEAVVDAFGAEKTADQTRTALKDARSRAADVAYPATRETADAVDVSGAMGVIDARLGNRVSGDGTDGVFARFRERLADETGFDRVLGVKQDLQDEIGAAVRAGRSNQARQLKELEGALDKALETASPRYRTANDDFARASRVIEAVDEGAAMARPGARASDTTKRFSQMTPNEKNAARAGYGDRLLARIEAAAGENANRARPLTSTKAKTEAEAMAIDPGMFARRMGRENVMHETMSRALGGSRTADNLEDIADLDGYDGVLSSLLTGNWRRAAMQGLQGASNTALGIDPGTRQIIARALMSNNTDSFKKAVNQSKSSDQRRAVVDALVRATERSRESVAAVP